MSSPKLADTTRENVVIDTGQFGLNVYFCAGSGKLLPDKQFAFMALKTCKNGHQFNKTSDCPTCPVCEKERKPHEGFLSILAAPARRALEHAGIRTLEKLAEYSERDILNLHGVGKSSIPALRSALKEAGMRFKK